MPYKSGNGHRWIGYLVPALLTFALGGITYWCYAGLCAAQGQAVILGVTAIIVLWYAWWTREMAIAARDATRDNQDMLCRLGELVEEMTDLTSSNKDLASRSADLAESNADLAASNRSIADTTISLVEGNQELVRATNEVALATTWVAEAAKGQLQLARTDRTTQLSVRICTENRAGRLVVSLEVENLGPGAASRIQALGWAEPAVSSAAQPVRLGPKRLAAGERWSADETVLFEVDTAQVASVDTEPHTLTVLVHWADDLKRPWAVVYQLLVPGCSWVEPRGGPATRRGWPRPEDGARCIKGDPEWARLLEPDADHNELRRKVQRLLQEEGAEPKP